ncbi:hypothetical protein [Nonomuraea sp. NPDC049480]|uniref:hypothetical protein n=1 Tax=Nonomuraea sp. NPDC049480 TaxID=3364353 RepID=UPI00379D08F6
MAVTAGELLESVRRRVEWFTRTSDTRDLCDPAGLRDAAALLAAAGTLRGRSARKGARAAVGLLRYARHLVRPDEEDGHAADELLAHADAAEIAAVRQAAERSPLPGPELPPVEHLTMATLGASLAHLDDLVARIRYGLSDPVTVDELRYLVIVAEAREARWGRTGAAEDLDDAVAAMDDVVNRTPDDHEWYPGRMSRLGGLLQFRFAVTGERQDLDTGIEAIRTAAEAVPPGHEDWPMFRSNLGRALLFRYGATGREADLDEAVSMLTEAVAGTAGDELVSIAASRLGLLQQATLARYHLRGDVDDLDSALDMARQAWEATPEGDHNLLDRALDLGRTHLAAFQYTGDTGHAATAEQLARQIVKATPREHTDHQAAKTILDQLRTRRAGQ